MSGRLGRQDVWRADFARVLSPRAAQSAGEGIAVRVVDVGERRWLGWLVFVVAGLETAAIMLHLWSPHDVLGISRIWAFGIAAALWAGGTLLQWRPRPWVTTATVRGNALHLGRRKIRFGHMLGVKVARGARGFSVAIGERRRGGQFLEIERESEARRLFEELGVTWPGTPVCTLRSRCGETSRDPSRSSWARSAS